MDINNQPIMRAASLPNRKSTEKAIQKVATYGGQRYGSDYSDLVSRSGYHDLDTGY